MRLLSILFLLPALAVAAVDKGDRILAIDVTTPASLTYDQTWPLAAACGIDTIGLSLDWNQIETGPGTFVDPGGAFAAANIYYPAKGVTLTLRPLHNAVKAVPVDLAGTDFADGSHIMATRFCACLDWVMMQLPDVTIDTLLIGSEYDVWLGTDADRWDDWTDFLTRVTQHVRAAPYAAHIPRIGAEATHAGYVAEAARITAVNALCDVAAVSYYAIDGAFDVKDQATLLADLDGLLPFASTVKPLVFIQYGCPSAWHDGTGVQDRRSEQEAFIETTFAWWDDHADVVRAIDVTWLHDVSEAALDEYEAYFGLVHPAFRTFLGSLGLRTHAGPGTDKPAYLALLAQANARGWDGGSGGGGGPGGGGGAGGGAGGEGPLPRPDTVGMFHIWNDSEYEISGPGPQRRPGPAPGPGIRSSLPGGPGRILRSGQGHGPPPAAHPRG